MKNLMWLINLVFGFIETIVGLRFILKLLGANPNTPFVDWWYQTSLPLIRPFGGIFPSPVVDTRFILELPSLFAILIYGLLAYFIIQIINYLHYLTTHHEPHKHV